MKPTKSEVRAARAAWRQALAEGRVLRYLGGSTFKSFPTVEALKAELARLAPGTAEVAKP